MIHVDFADWKDAPSAKLFYMDTVPGFGGYKCAPEMFYFHAAEEMVFHLPDPAAGLLHQRNP